jgi:alkylation response protein AidB-like acyl-CoA dehydrogenase
LKTIPTLFLPAYNALYYRFKTFAESFPTDELANDDHNQFFDRKLWDQAGVEGMHGLLADKTFGGQNFSVKETCAAFEGFANGCKNNGLLFSIAAHLAACVASLNLFGTGWQKQNVLPLLTSGNAIAANAITELNSGSDVFAMETSARKTGDHYVVTGNKSYITNAPVAEYVLVYAQTSAEKGFFGGITAFLVQLPTAGVELSQPINKMGLRTCSMAHLSFNELVVPISARIGEEGGGSIIFNRSMIIERTIMAAINLGQLERVFKQTVSYCKTRKINGMPLRSLTHIAHQLADIAMHIEAAKALVYAAADAIDTNANDTLLRSSMAKCYVSEHAINGIKIMQEMHGAYGYTSAGDIEREYRDIFATGIYSGTNSIQKNIIAKHV